MLILFPLYRVIMNVPAYVGQVKAVFTELASKLLTTAGAEKYLQDIKKAMEKQYENLYDDDKLDLSVEMDAMTMAAKSDGLISDEAE